MRRFGLMLMLSVVVLAACTQDKDDSREPTPTIPAETATVTPTNTPETATSTPGPTLPPSATFPPTLTPSATFSPEPPTGSPTPPPTPGPIEYVVRPGDDCTKILALHGHGDFQMLDEFYALNNMTGCFLGQGQTVLVPRPEAVGQGITAADPSQPTPTAPISCGSNCNFMAVQQYCAVADDTVTSIALKNNTTIRKICEMNPMPDGINCSGCDFSQSDMGICPREVAPQIGIGQCLNVPGPTPTPTITPTPSGSETPTMTPTHRAPAIVSPMDGAAVSGLVRLQWVSVGLLQPDEYYVIHLLNETTGATLDHATRTPSFTVPRDFLLTTGEAQQVRWSVSIEQQRSDGLLIPVGGRTPDYHFVWQ